MLPELLKQRDVFKLEDSAIFGVKEDWLAVIEYVQAIAALGKGDKDAFKKHITEAFWLSPRQASAFAPHIERLRLDECMRVVKIDFTAKLVPLAPGDPVALEQLIAGKKALLFHFWSPLSRECEAAMPDFVATAAALSANDIAVVSLLPDDSPKLLTEARAMLHPLGAKPPGAWLIDCQGETVRTRAADSEPADDGARFHRRKNSLQRRSNRRGILAGLAQNRRADPSPQIGARRTRSDSASRNYGTHRRRKSLPDRS